MRRNWPTILFSYSDESLRTEVSEAIKVFNELIDTPEAAAACKMLQAISAFDNLMGRAGLEFHTSVTRLLTAAAAQKFQKYPSLLARTDGLPWNYRNIRDPCLAMIAMFSGNGQNPTNITLTRSYLSSHQLCCGYLRECLYANIHLDDPPTAWQLRSVMGPSKDLYLKALLESRSLVCTR